MKEDHSRVFTGNVLVNCDNVDVCRAKRFQYCLQLVFQYCEVTTTSASSGAPAKAAHVLTPRLFPTLHPSISTSRPIVTLYIPSLASPFWPKTWLIASPSIEFLSGSRPEPKDFAGLALAVRISFSLSKIARTP